MINQVLILQALITQNIVIPVVALGTKRGCSERARIPPQVRAAESASYFLPRLVQGSTSFTAQLKKSSHRKINSATFYYTVEERACY